MAKSSGQKLKLLYLIKMLQENTDENHPMSTPDIIKYLENQGIHAERKSIYSDMESLADFGYDVVQVQSRLGGGYYLGSREFELPELKLLVDAVQSSRFITTKKSRDLIRKLEQIAGKNDAGKLQRQVYVAGRIKTENESIYYNIDAIHRAIQENRQITFVYLDWNLQKELVPRLGGDKCVSPWALIWRDENYYLVAYDAKAQIMKHYRVDKIQALSVSEHDREGTEVAAKVNPAVYTEEKFGMFAGNEEIVTLRYDQSIAGVLFDRFGQAVSVRKLADGNYTMRVRLSLSQQFYGWLTGLGAEIEIVAPAYVREEYKAYIQGILHVYQEKERSK